MVHCVMTHFAHNQFLKCCVTCATVDLLLTRKRWDSLH